MSGTVETVTVPSVAPATRAELESLATDCGVAYTPEMSAATVLRRLRLHADA